LKQWVSIPPLLAAAGPTNSPADSASESVSLVH